MDRNSSADSLPPVLSVENLIRGTLTLGEQLAKTILAGLQKGLENLVRAGLLPPYVAREFRQLKAKILEGSIEETTVKTEKNTINIVDIGRMMFECGWEVYLLVNDGFYPNNQEKSSFHRRKSLFVFYFSSCDFISKFIKSDFLEDISPFVFLYFAKRFLISLPAVAMEITLSK